MSALVISLLFGGGIAAYVWSYMAHRTGNAKPGQVVAGAGIIGGIAFLLLYAILKWSFDL